MQSVSLNRTHRILVGIVCAGAIVIAAIGFAGSYAAVRDLAEKKGFGAFAPFFPIGIDAGIVVLLALDLLLTWIRIPFPLLRQTAWLLTAATIAFNGAAAWPDPLGVGMHAVIPILFVVAVEAARHAIGRIADITADKHMEGVRLSRWLLAFPSTFRLWRRMKLWELRSYEQVIIMEQDRLVYEARLRARYGRGWRRKAPVESLMPLRLARYGVPLAETGAAGLAAAGIKVPARLAPASGAGRGTGAGSGSDAGEAADSASPAAAGTAHEAGHRPGPVPLRKALAPGAEQGRAPAPETATWPLERPPAAGADLAGPHEHAGPPTDFAAQPPGRSHPSVAPADAAQPGTQAGGPIPGGALPADAQSVGAPPQAATDTDQAQQAQQAHPPYGTGYFDARVPGYVAYPDAAGTGHDATRPADAETVAPAEPAYTYAAETAHRSQVTVPVVQGGRQRPLGRDGAPDGGRSAYAPDQPALFVEPGTDPQHVPVPPQPAAGHTAQPAPPPAPEPVPDPYGDDEPVGLPDGMTVDEVYFSAYLHIAAHGSRPTARDLSRTLNDQFGVTNADGNLLSEPHLRRYLPELRQRYNAEMGIAG